MKARWGDRYGFPVLMLAGACFAIALVAVAVFRSARAEATDIAPPAGFVVLGKLPTGMMVFRFRDEQRRVTCWVVDYGSGWGGAPAPTISCLPDRPGDGS